MRILILLLFPLFSFSQLSIGILESSRILDADAQSFITAANITDVTQKIAINNLVIGLKADGLWTKMKAIYPFVGGTASSHKFNLKDPRDLNAAFRLLFVGGWTHSSTGALPNGTSGYANTYLTPSTSLTELNSHLSFYSRTNAAGGCAIGSVLSPTFTTANQMFVKFTDGNFYGEINNRLSSVIFANIISTGFYITSRTANNSLKAYKNNSLAATNTTTITAISNPNQIFISARNDNTSVTNYDNKECAFASIGDGLSDTEAANYYTRVQAYQTALGRQL